MGSQAKFKTMILHSIKFFSFLKELEQYNDGFETKDISFKRTTLHITYVKDGKEIPVKIGLLELKRGWEKYNEESRKR